MQGGEKEMGCHVISFLNFYPLLRNPGPQMLSLSAD